MSMNAHNVPEPLRAFIPIVEKWGAVNGDFERYALADRAEENPNELAELKEFAAKWTLEHQELFDTWADQMRMTECLEVAKFYFTLMLLAELEIGDRSEEVNGVDRAIADLNKKGSYRLASLRMWAARSLPDYGPDARRAIPDLQRALDDEDWRVRVWTHFALALLEGNFDQHRAAIESIRRNREVGMEGCMEAKAALDELSLPPQQRDLKSFTSAAVTGDLENLTRLITSVDVDATDHNGQRALDYAVGNGHPSAVEMLLRHGANANLRGRNGDAPLHSAAARRSTEIVRLLVENGADINAKDHEGRTPLDIAIEYKQPTTIDYLTKLGALRG